jgi:hypothetical protein
MLPTTIISPSKTTLLLALLALLAAFAFASK